MKTLDEVIAELEDEGLFADALQYLKEYRAEKDDLERTKKMCFEFVGSKMIEAEKRGMTIRCPNCGDEFIILPESNDPLIWDELRTMEGKPMMVESTTLVLNRNMDENEFWQAYRKERGNAQV